VEPWFTNLIRSWRPFVTRNVRKPKLLWSHGVLFNNILKNQKNAMKLKRRHGEFEQGCVLSESYTATDALPLILPACRQSLLPACVFVTRDTVCHLRLVFWKICSWTNLFVMRSIREPRFHCISKSTHRTQICIILLIFLPFLIKGKGNVHHRTGHKGPEGEQRYTSTLSLTLALDGCGWSIPRPIRFTPRKDLVPIVQEAGWAPGPDWMGMENITFSYCTW
jgi:hypothetical protein